MRAGILLAMLSLWTASAMSQTTWRVTTEAPRYGYGETIRVTATLYNPAPDTLVFLVDSGPPPCGGRVAFDGFERWDGFACVAMEAEYRLPPRSRLEWRYALRPAVTGFPLRDGRHAVRVSLNAYRRQPGGWEPLVREDSAVFEAPAYRGGTLALTYRTADSLRVRPLRDSLAAQVTQAYAPSPGATYAHWQVEGLPLDQFRERLARDARFQQVRALHLFTDRGTPTFEERYVGVEPGVSTAATLQAPSPQPFTSHTRLTFTPGVAGPVRAEAFDALGRRMAVVYDGTAPAGVPLTLVLDGTALRPGLYFVRVTMATGVWTRTAIRVAR